MKKSLAQDGQINPISVSPITPQKFRLVAGATRFLAAKELGWKKIHASVWIGSDVDYRIHELIENVERRELSSEQRKVMKAKVKELQAQRLATVAPAMGGRGNKGGVRDEARQMGISQTTAQRRKMNQNPKSGSVSTPSGPKYPHKASSGFPDADYKRLQAWCSKQGNITIAEGIRRIVRDFLDAEDEHSDEPAADAAE